MDQRVVLTFQFYCLKTVPCKAIDALEIPLLDLGKVNWKILWKRFTILDAIKNNQNSWEEAKINSNMKLAAIFMADFEGFKTSVEEVTEDVIEVAKELELEVKSEDVSELLQSHDKTLMDEKLLFMDAQRKWFLEIESAPGGGAVKVVEMIAHNF